MKVLFNILMTIATMTYFGAGICAFFYILFFCFAKSEDLEKASVWPFLFIVSLGINGLALTGWLDANADKFKTK